jgi:hypothetical protein
VADPFPHVVVDDFLPPEALDLVLAEFPGPDAIDWKRFADGAGRNLATRDEAQMGPRTLELIHHLNSSRFLRVLEAMTGIEGLIPDPQLEGGGLHQIERGARSDIDSCRGERQFALQLAVGHVRVAAGKDTTAKRWKARRSGRSRSTTPTRVSPTASMPASRPRRSATPAS